MRDMIYLGLARMSEDGQELKYIKEAFDTNWIVPLGPNVNAFEHELESFVNHIDGSGTLDRKVVCLNSGTSAIHLALIACGVGPGDEVCVQSFTFCASSNPIVYLGAKPVFIGSEADTWNMDPELLELAIRDRKEKTGKYPKAIIPVSLYGMPYQIDRIMKIADKYGIPVVEDSAEGMGTRFNGQALGTFGKFGVLSFNGNKMITTSGGGALICNGASPKSSPKGKDFGVHTADPMWYGMLKDFAEENRNNPTEAESALWNALKGKGIGFKFRQQHIIEDFIVDFYCNDKKLTIELDGGYHNAPGQMKSDEERTARLKELGYTEIRFTNEQVLCNFDNTLAEIERVCKSLPSGGNLEETTSEDLAREVMWYATQARDAYPYYQHTAIGYNYRMSNVCAGIGRGQMTVLGAHIAHHKHVQALYEKLLADVKGFHIHKQPENRNSETGEAIYDSNFWLCSITIDPDVRIQGQENAYKKGVTTAVGGAAGVIRQTGSAVTDCQPNDNVEALREFLLSKNIDSRPLWKPMHLQPVYSEGASQVSSTGCGQSADVKIIEGPRMAVYTTGVEESLFKVGICLPCGPWVTDEDVEYIVECIKEASCLNS